MSKSRRSRRELAARGRGLVRLSAAHSWAAHSWAAHFWARICGFRRGVVRWWPRAGFATAPALRPSRALSAALGVALLLCWAQPSLAEVTTSLVDGFRLTVPAQENLLRLQDQWLVWSSAFLKDDQVLAESAVRDLLLTAGELGFAGLPDLSLGVAARAVEAAREGQSERANWALEMAERLDPGRPEVAFARMRVTRLEGRYFAAFAALLSGYWRALNEQLARRLVLFDVTFWIVLSLTITSLLFVALEMATKGWALVRDLAGRVSSFSPGMMSIALAALLLVWPLFLPGGWVWLVLLWAAMLWSYCSTSERGALAVAIAVLSLGPAVLATVKSGLEVDLLPAVRAVNRVQEGRLYGQLFRDLKYLEDTLPESAERQNLLADLHVGMGQDELARPVYRAVLEKDPHNGEALNNLGAFHFRRGENIEAIEFFAQAVEVPEAELVAAYNLAQTYQRLLEFDRADEYLRRARAIDAGRVSDWLSKEEAPIHMPLPAVSYARLRASVRAQSSDAPPAWPELLRGLGLAVGVVLGGGVLGGLRRTTIMSSGGADRLSGWRRIVLPGLMSLEAGDGGRAYLALLIPITALMMPLSVLWSAKLPWPYDPTLTVALSLCLVGLLGFFAGRASIR